MRTSSWQILKRRPDTAWLKAGALAVCAACSGSEASAPPDETAAHLRQAPQEAELVQLTAPADELREALLEQTGRRSLSGLSRIARDHEAFVSNTDGMPHREYWDLMRRIGIDPNAKLETLLSGPPGQRLVDGELWFVWPDLAARDPAELVPEKLSFQDRRRLQELIGEDGISRLRDGEGFPGMRTAISANGRWMYYILSQENEEKD